LGRRPSSLRQDGAWIGRRLQGEFSLVRLKRGATGKEWLLIKRHA
jgi:hypothetical protein